MTACDCRYLQIFFLMGLKDLCCRYRSRHRDTGLAVPEGRHYHVFVFSDSYGSFFQAILATAASVVFSLLLLEQSAWRAWHLRQRQHIPRPCAQRCHLKQRLRLETCLKKHRKGKKNTCGIPRRVTLICCLLYVVYVLDCTSIGWNSQVFESEKQSVARFFAVLLVTGNTGCVDNATIEFEGFVLQVL